MPCAHADAMYSKCGVAPLIRQPRQTTPATRPVSAMRCGGHRDLERAGHAQHFDVAVGQARLRERLLRAGQQPLGDEIVEARDDDARCAR